MDLFSLPGIPSTKETDKQIANKTATKSVKQVMKAGNSLLDRINNMTKFVEEKLFDYKDKYECIRTEERLFEYISQCIFNGECAIDTETTGLNPMLDEIVGFSLYTPGRLAIYVPINHINYISNEKIENQLSKELVKEQLQRLVDNNVKLIMFNAKFDIRVIRHQIGVYMTAYWDGYLGSMLLNENEETHKLKPLHNKYVLNNEKDAWSFSDLFDKIPFNLVPIRTAYVYAARDAEITYELYKYQEQFLDKTSQKCIDKDLTRVADVFRNIEMPLINVVADMEDNGVLIDQEYSKQLFEKYNKVLIEKEAEFYKLCDKYADKINAYKQKNPDNKLGSMINIASSTQIAILLYDILEEKPVPRQPVRGTGEEVLKAMDNEFCKVILDYREVAKLISTYIDKLPQIVNPNDGKIHCSFNQYGTKTGRFSSNEPNMQNIPARADDIRQMFIAGEGRVFISSDYSQQEPRTLSYLAQDEIMMNAYKHGKDMYSMVASKIYKVPYEDCLEFYLDENGNKTDKVNKDGKKRRKSVKSLFLGITYGMSIQGVADNLKVSKEEAKKFWNDFYKEFPKVKQYVEYMPEFARENGYVETAWGRKRRLPEMQLPPYEFDFSKKIETNFDPLSFEVTNTIEDVDYTLMDKYTKLMNKAYGRQQKEQIKEQARREGIEIKDNGGKIADAERQCVNSIIQGSAADMTKLAMISIGTNKRLKELDCKLAIQVHDEVIVDCPKENAKECAELVSRLMIEAAQSKIEVPMKCDAEIMEKWE